MPSQLNILRQESLTEESFIQNGQQKNVHVVAKGIAFTVVVGSVNKDVDFHKHVITASVIYDYGKKETEAKEVSFVNIKPLEYKAHVTERGTQANVELRMYVLSSQHENQTFRVRLEVEDLSLSVVTQSIRVISKVSLLNKKEKKTKKRHIEEVQSASSSPEQPQVGIEDFSGTLYRLEQQQQEQMRLLQGIAQFNSQLQNTLGSWTQIPSGNSVCQPTDFETAFQLMLDSYHNLPQDQKPEKLRKVLSMASLQAPDFMEQCLASDCAKSNQDPNATCTCPNCPYQKQVTDIDSFYNEFLASPERDSMDDFSSQAEPLGFLL